MNPLTSVNVGSTVPLIAEAPAQLHRKSDNEWEVQRRIDGGWVTAAIIERHAVRDFPWDIYPPNGTRAEDGEDAVDEKSALDLALGFSAE
jgi:hypothetical protein